MKTHILFVALTLAFGWANAQNIPVFEFEDDHVAWPGLGSIPDFAMDEQGKGVENHPCLGWQR